MKPRFGPFLPRLCVFLLWVVALGAGALGCLVGASNELGFNGANPPGAGGLFTLAFLSGAAAIGIQVWLRKRAK